MADLKISDLPTDVATLASGDIFPCAKASNLSINTFATAQEIKTHSNNAPTFDAGSASANSKPKLQSASLLTTPEDGALEFSTEGLYFTASTNAVNKIPTIQYARLNSAPTLANNTGFQALFSPSALTITTGVYIYNCMFSVSGMSATLGNIGFRTTITPATATISNGMILCIGIDGTGGAASQTGCLEDDATGVPNILTAATATSAFVNITGTFTCTSSGTIVPAVALATAVATAVVSQNSYFSIERICDSGTTNIGAWS